jgi:ribokinase
MTRILVSGLANIETTLKVPGFPIRYTPVEYNFFDIQSTVSGVGFNIALALTRLGDEVVFLSLIGRDAGGRLVRLSLEDSRIDDANVLPQMDATAQSIILYDPAGRRQIHVDLKDIQQHTYPLERFEQTIEDCELLVLCNTNFSRPFLKIGRRAGKKIASDLHTISDLEDPYNQDFMQAADILFMSDDLLPVSPEAWSREIITRYEPEILVIGLGAAGALLYVREDGCTSRLPAVQTRPVISMIGAGDALFSAFLHGYLQSGDPYQALKKAIVFASYKIGSAGAAQGYLDPQALEDHYANVQDQFPQNN